MSDFAFEYFNRELDNLDVPALTKIFEKVKKLLAQKKKAEKPFQTVSNENLLAASDALINQNMESYRELAK